MCVVKTLVTIDTKSLVLFRIDDVSVMQRSMCDICLCKDRAKIVKLTQWQSHGKSLNKVVMCIAFTTKLQGDCRQ